MITLWPTATLQFVGKEYLPKWAPLFGSGEWTDAFNIRTYRSIRIGRLIFVYCSRERKL